LRKLRMGRVMLLKWKGPIGKIDAPVYFGSIS